MNVQRKQVVVVLMGFALSSPAGAQSVDQPQRTLVQQQTVAPYSRLRVGSAMQVRIQAGNPQQVQLTGQDYLLPFVRLTVKDGELSVGFSRPIRRKGTRAVDVILYQNRLTCIQIREAAAVSSAVLLGEAQLSLDLDESSSVSAPIAADTLSVTLSGSSVAELGGGVVAASLRVSGASQLTADRLRVSRVQATIMGSSQASLTVLHALSIRASGDSSFLYAGHPTITQLVSEQATVKPKMDRQP